MILQYHKIALAVGFALAMALTFSCSSGGGGGNDPVADASSSSVGKVGEVSSSSGPSEGGSSSSVGNAVVSSSSSGVIVSSSSNDLPIIGYCDYGPIQSNGDGGCFAMATADDQANCNKWGNVVSSCPSSSSSVDLCAGFVDGTKREHYGMEKAQFCDSRDGKKYVYVTIGTQTWMAENLNIEIGNYECYYEVYGCLYNWNTALNACPSGWRLPRDSDWNVLITAVGGSSKEVSTKLRAADGWVEFNGNLPSNGTDDFGFSALPGGSKGTGPDRNNVYRQGYWWSADESKKSGADANYWYMNSGGIYSSANQKSLPTSSVRCIKD